MFIHYYRYKTKYTSKVTTADDRLQIMYPASDRAMITTGHDFYVIGTIQGVEVRPDAELKVELISLENGETIRTVTANKKDNQQGMYTSYEGIETEDSEEIVRKSGMPDLVYDPEHPESFWYTWNKAYYADNVFSALIYGGTCRLGQIYPYDQNGKLLEPIEEGYYEIRVTLINGEEIITSGKTVWITQGQKEILLSRFSPEAHVERVKRFAQEEGFESFTDPYAGIWDTQYFSFEWPVKAWVEIPGRWHFGDAQEYETGRVHFFDYNISEACVSWKTEIGTMLTKDRSCVDNPDRLVSYYYKNGTPQEATAKVPAGELAVIAPGKYFVVTGKQIRSVAEGRAKKTLIIDAVCKPLPSTTKPLTECAYQIENRIECFDYQIYQCKEDKLQKLDGCRTGVIRQVSNAPDEYLVLHVHHELDLGNCNFGDVVSVQMEAKDCYGAVWGRERFEIEI